MKTYQGKQKDIVKKWHLIDASDKILGRMSTQIATLLMGKHKPTYTPYLDTGDFVIVINANKIKVTGKKMQAKIYDTYSGYPSGRKTKNLAKMMDQKPEEVIRLAVRRMLPKTTLGKNMIDKLKVYAESEHPHQAQEPTVYTLKY